MWYPRGYQGSSLIWEELLGSLNSFKGYMKLFQTYQDFGTDRWRILSVLTPKDLVQF